jgi:DNA polymerase-3 subunit epsilon
MRQIVLDTETTGLSPQEGHRIIEIGCVELIDRKLTGQHFHEYIQPQREVDPGAFAVHGISDEFLKDKPLFSQVSDAFIQYIDGAELIIHNAPFDVGFLDSELARLNMGTVEQRCTVLDTLVYARKKHPGQQNSLDALCRRYEINASERTLHGALLDAELLASVYLAMTGGQTSLFGDATGEQSTDSMQSSADNVGAQKITGLNVIVADKDELAAHQAQLGLIQKASEDGCVWLEE